MPARSIQLFQAHNKADAAARPVDAVITWVDDRTPGYRDLLKTYAKAVPDLDPSRTRDNLEILRYNLRLLERHAPWVNRVFLFTCRPQVPAWLDTAHPRLTVVHHDGVIAPDLLPTFNSFAIVSHLHLIPGLAETFLYLEDDMLLLRDVSLADFRAADGRLLVFEKPAATPTYEAIRDPAKERPWNLALAESNRLLDDAYGPARRGYVNHVPLLIDREQWRIMTERFAEAFAATRQARFRAAGNIAPEYLYPQFMLAEGKAERASPAQLAASCGYVPLEDFWPVTALSLWRVRRSLPKWVTLNDNFGNNPSRVTERMAQNFLRRVAPQPSAFERG
ncbi:MAG: stealth conserved region 3 domain-containing protein [Aestuariivirga sp.]|nr:stealth conserved region 3 domain-containing protein [Aestuariivirga sp.]